MSSAKLRLRLLWHPQAQFAGYLMAERLGLAARRGIDLSCVPVDFSLGPIDAVLGGDCQMAVASPSHIVESADRDALAFILAIQQRSPLVYPVRRGSGVEAVAQLKGRKVAVWPGGEDLELCWMLAKSGLDPSDVERIPMGDTVTPFVAGVVDCAQMTCYHELHEMEHKGVGLEDVMLFRADQLGASLIKDGIVARRDWLETNPEVAQSAVDAFLEGWTIAFAEPSRAIEVCAAARPDMTRQAHERQLADIRDLSLIDATQSHGLGYPEPGHLARAIEALEVLGQGIEGAEVSKFVDPRFWRAAPEAFRSREWPSSPSM